METFYNSAAEQAVALIEECQGCLEEAVGIARLRALQCDWRDDYEFQKWMLILRHLPRSVAEFESSQTLEKDWN